jgi:hypothetical protein
MSWRRFRVQAAQALQLREFSSVPSSLTRCGTQAEGFTLSPKSRPYKIRRELGKKKKKIEKRILKTYKNRKYDFSDLVYRKFGAALLQFRRAAWLSFTWPTTS